MQAKHTGFTLIEMVVGMLVLSISLVMLATVLFPQADRAVDALFRVRSAELGQSILNEIWGKRYDENTDPNGSFPCGASGKPACTTTPGPDTGETRDDWDDIDDFNGMTQNSNILGSSQTYANLYPGYLLDVTVGTGSSSRLITITITTPNAEKIIFNAVRSNF